MKSMNPWICPKCNRVYAPFIAECKKCNDELNKNKIIPESKSYHVVENLDGGERIRFNGGQP